MPEGKHSTVNCRLEALPVIDSSTCKKKTHSIITPPPARFQGPRGGRGWGAGPPPPLPTFWEKKIKIKKYTFSNKRNPWWNTNIRLADLSEASKFKIGPFRSYNIRWAQERMRLLILSWLVSLKTTIFTKLHLVVDFCVFTSQDRVCINNGAFFIKVLYKSPRSYDFLKQIELDNMVDRLRVVPHFSSWIAERAKRERAWKSPKKWERRDAVAPRVAFSRVGWFSHALAFRSLYYPWWQVGDYS